MLVGVGVGASCGVPNRGTRRSRSGVPHLPQERAIGKPGPVPLAAPGIGPELSTPQPLEVVLSEVDVASLSTALAMAEVAYVEAKRRSNG